MINKEIQHEGDRMSIEFQSIEKWLRREDGQIKKGVDIGCGTNRLSMEVLAIDQQADRRYAHADINHNCCNLEIAPTKFSGREYTFKDNELEFVFSSHCLEDFQDIQYVFINWWRKIQLGGLMILLLPDMEECKCAVCSLPQQIEYRNAKGMSARYWTLEDFNKTGKGNPSHKVNVGKKFMTNLLQALYEKDKIKYEMLQIDTIPHDKSCSIDFVIKKLK